MLTGTMAFLSIALPSGAYEVWNVPKYLTGDLSVVLLILVVAMLIGIIVGSGAASRAETVTITFTTAQATYLRRAYRLLFVLVIIGYAIWFYSAYRQGVNTQALLSVLSRDSGAISDLKSEARPIAGLTTLTQFGPLVVALGAVLNRLELAKHHYRVLLLLAAVRTVFYAERLAIIEVVIPLVIIAALTQKPGTRGATFARFAPVIVAPALWVVFAVSEFTRSWVYYQTLTDLPFAQWVSLRLAGYYTTSFNNSAMLANAHQHLLVPPYFSVEGFWNAPVVSVLLDPPSIEGMSPEDWWSYILRYNGNPDFNNTGSFLVTYAEFGLLAAVVLWLVVGVLVGVVFSRMTQGSLPALLAVSTLFVGILELSRFVYWTQGRAVPLIVALIVIAVTYPAGALARPARVTGVKWDVDALTR